MYSIGIFTSENSLNEILKLDQEFAKYSNITYLPYTSMEHLKYLYKENINHFDGIIFSGSFPYKVILENFKEIPKPHAYFIILERDYFRIIANLAISNPKLDFSRVYFDEPEISVDFNEIFHDSKLPMFGNPCKNILASDMENSYNQTLKYYKSIWKNGNIDLIVTRFSSMINALEKDNIHYKYLSPSSKSMLETFNGLMIHLNVNVPQSSITCIGIVTSSDSSITNLQFKNLSIKLQTFNDKFGKPFLIYDYGDSFEIATDSITMNDLTKKHTICPLASFLKDSLNFPINVGWGEDDNVVKARNNATAALKEAKKSDDFSSFLISYGKIIGPLNNDGYLSMDKNEHFDNSDEEKNSVSSLYLSKLKSYMEENETDLVTSKDLSEYLSITVRSASRMLKKFSKNGIVILEDMQQINSRGRPTQVYRIDIDN